MQQALSILRACCIIKKISLNKIPEKLCHPDHQSFQIFKTKLLRRRLNDTNTSESMILFKEDFPSFWTCFSRPGSDRHLTLLGVST